MYNNRARPFARTLYMRYDGTSLPNVRLDKNNVTLDTNMPWSLFDRWAHCSLWHLNGFKRGVRPNGRSGFLNAMAMTIPRLYLEPRAWSSVPARLRRVQFGEQWHMITFPVLSFRIDRCEWIKWKTSPGIRSVVLDTVYYFIRLLSQQDIVHLLCESEIAASWLCVVQACVDFSFNPWDFVILIRILLHLYAPLPAMCSLLHHFVVSFVFHIHKSYIFLYLKSGTHTIFPFDSTIHGDLSIWIQVVGVVRLPICR
jgi:hypothetical protein